MGGSFALALCAKCNSEFPAERHGFSGYADYSREVIKRIIGRIGMGLAVCAIHPVAVVYGAKVKGVF